jgi:hypothetical protein
MHEGTSLQGAQESGKQDSGAAEETRRAVGEGEEARAECIAVRARARPSAWLALAAHAQVVGRLVKEQHVGLHK